MAASENDYHSRGIIVIAICEGSRFLITHDAVQEAVGKSLGIPTLRLISILLKASYCCCRRHLFTTVRCPTMLVSL
jgi:hypothetical protein